MAHLDSPLWIQPAVQPGGGCGACGSSAAGPVCRAELAFDTCASPRLSGEAAWLRRGLASLDTVVDVTTGRSLVALQFIEALRIEDGVAELALTFPLHCQSKPLADQAFQALRRALPDTDIYVTHPRG
jgi:hypothetical protein